MRRIEQARLILAVSNDLRCHGSWSGETHIQKATYFLQEMLGVPISLKFILYKHGPFSFELRNLLSEMEADQFVRWEPRQPPYGPCLVPGLNSELLLAGTRSDQNYSRQIEFVSEKLAEKRVVELEKLATALYVSSSTDPSHRAVKINALKPHISLQEADTALSQVAAIRRDAFENGLIANQR